jgi:hypothetical protein
VPCTAAHDRAGLKDVRPDAFRAHGGPVITRSSARRALCATRRVNPWPETVIPRAPAFARLWHSRMASGSRSPRTRSKPPLSTHERARQASPFAREQRRCSGLWSRRVTVATAAGLILCRCVPWPCSRMGRRSTPAWRAAVRPGRGSGSGHLCGAWYRALGPHLRRHGWTVDEYRRAVGLSPRRALQAPSRSRRQAANARTLAARDPRVRAGLAVGDQVRGFAMAIPNGLVRRTEPTNDSRFVDTDASTTWRSA